MKTVHIVYGPPLAGKSTFVRENMGPDDLVFDMDAVQNALCYGADHAGKPHTLGAAIIAGLVCLPPPSVYRAIRPPERVEIHRGYFLGG